MKKVVLVYFSPTHTTKLVLEGIARGIDREVLELDLTTDDILNFKANRDDLVIVGAPTYSSRIPQKAFDRLVEIKGAGGPAVAVSVYGNAKYGNALKEIQGLLASNGFYVIAGAAFIGEHSFSSDKHPIAVGRPNDKDLEKALDFGNKISDKLELEVDLKDMMVSNIPGEFPLEPRKIMGPMQSYPGDECNNCGACISACPVNAIGPDLICDSTKCIKCFACVKVCPKETRYFDNEGLINTAIKLEKLPHKEPELFLN